MEKVLLISDGYIDSETELDYRHITNFREAFPLIHDHDYYELFLVTRGRFVHLINGERVIVQHGNLVFIRPSDTHGFEKLRGEKCGFINLAILKDTINELFDFLGPAYDKDRLLLKELPPMVILSKGQTQLLFEKMDRLNTIAVNNKAEKRMLLRILLIEIFANHFNVISRRSKKDVPQWLQQLTEEMQKPANFVEGLTALIRISCKSQEHLCRTFKKYLEKSPTQYINELRLNYSANQLLFSQKQIAQIAYDAGFENISHFYHLFGLLFEMSPAKFRAKNLRNPAVKSES